MGFLDKLSSKLESKQQTFSSPSSQPETQKPAVDPSLGLPAGGLAVNGLAIGFYPAYGTNNAKDINAHLPRPMSIIGDFIQISPQDMTLNQLIWHQDDFGSQPGSPVYLASVMPQGGLKAFGHAEAEKVAAQMRKVNEKGMNVYLRFGHEMNGDWYPYGQQPKPYIEAWKKLTLAVRKQCVGLPARTYMLWAPNVADSTDGSKGYKPYFPGPEWVDIAGISLYVYGSANVVSDKNYFKKHFDAFYQLYGKKHNLPCILAETGDPYRMEMGNHQPLGGGAREMDMKLSWINQVANMAQSYPNLKALVWFEYEKDEEGQYRDFRLILGQPETRQAAIDFFRQHQQ